MIMTYEDMIYDRQERTDEDFDYEAVEHSNALLEEVYPVLFKKIRSVSKMLYRIHNGSSGSRKYAWGEEKMYETYENMLEVYEDRDLIIDVCVKGKWKTIKGRLREGRY